MLWSFSDKPELENQILSHYKILEKLGQGGMGVVYKAEDINLKRTVAIKLLSPTLVADEEDKARFLIEAQAAAALDHPNICTVYEFNEDKGHAFMAMAYIEGRTLKELIQSTTLPLEKALDVAIQAARGLNEAHEKGIVHRDIKSANLMVAANEQVKIMDFGLAKREGGVTITKIGTTMGTLGYMSPEQARGEGVDQRTDIWSLGVVLYEMLAGRLPFKSEYDQAIIYSILNEEPKAIGEQKRGVPPQLEQVVAKAMAKDLEERYQSVSEMLEDLEDVRRGIEPGVAGRRPGIFRRKPPGKKLRYALSATAVLVLISLGVLTVNRLQLFQADVIQKSVAVLPFENLSDNIEDAYFSDGITEDIIVALSKIEDLIVISRSSVMQYKKSKKSFKEIAKELGVRTILTGSVRRSGQRTRIVGRLVDASTGEQIWGEPYDRELKDIFSIQRDVAEKIALALKAKLSPSEREEISKQPTMNLTAYDYYLKGRDFYYRYDKQSNEDAIAMFRKATELDPKYALAYAGLGDAFAQRANTFGFPPEWADSAASISMKALSIDPDLAEAYKSMGTAYATKGWLSEALISTRRSVELNPNFAPAAGNVGGILIAVGKLDEALFWLKKAFTLSPTSAFYCSAVGSIYFGLNEDAEAEKWFRKALLLQPDFAYARAGLGYLSLAQGKYHSAREIAMEILSNNPEDFFGMHLAADAGVVAGNYGEAEEHYMKLRKMSSQTNFYSGKRPSTSLGYLYIRDGRREEAQKMFKESIELDQKEIESGNEWYDMGYDMAAVNAAQNNKDEAYRWLQDAIDKGWRFFRLGMRDPLFGELRDEERFIGMMNEVMMKVEGMQGRVAPMRAPHRAQ